MFEDLDDPQATMLTPPIDAVARGGWCASGANGASRPPAWPRSCSSSASSRRLPSPVTTASRATPSKRANPPTRRRRRCGARRRPSTRPPPSRRHPRPKRRRRPPRPDRGRRPRPFPRMIPHSCATGATSRSTRRAASTSPPGSRSTSSSRCTTRGRGPSQSTTDAPGSPMAAPRSSVRRASAIA